MGVIDDAAEVALEMAVIDGIETDQGAEEAPIRFDRAPFKEAAAGGQAPVQFVERGENRPARPFVGGLGGGKARPVYAIVDILIDEPGQAPVLLIDFRR